MRGGVHARVCADKRRSPTIADVPTGFQAGMQYSLRRTVIMAQITDRRTATGPSPSAQLAWLSFAMFLGMTLWFSATAANAPIVAEFHLSASQTAWLTMAVQGGFVIGTLASALLNLPDVLNPRRLFNVGCIVGALANAGLAIATGPISIIVLRVVTGAALAWVYPPGMKIAAGWFEARRGAALGVLIGALTVGSAFPHLLAAVSAAVPWRVLMLVASTLAILGGGIVLAFVRDGPYVASSARFDPSAVARVFRDRETRLATLGYLGHMWELYAMWTWAPVMIRASLNARGQSASLADAASFVVIGAGAVGCVAAGLLADRVGRTVVTSAAMAVSGACCLTVGFLFGAHPALLLAVAAVWGASVVADSAQFSACVTELGDPKYMGTALTVQTCCGFLLTTASIQLIPFLEARVGWRYAFAVLAIGPAFGVASMLRLRGLPGAARIAHGKR